MFDLTVLIPTYNRANRLVKSLNSYLSEDLKNVEFLVIDNDSSDNTFLSLKNYIENGKIRYEKNYKNIGANRSLYFGFLKAKSKWICILPDDDYLEKGFLSELIIATKKNSNKGLIIPAQKHMNGEYTKCFDKSTSLSNIFLKLLAVSSYVKCNLSIQSIFIIQIISKFNSFKNINQSGKISLCKSGLFKAVVAIINLLLSIILSIYFNIFKLVILYFLLFNI